MTKRIAALAIAAATAASVVLTATPAGAYHCYHGPWPDPVCLINELFSS